MNQEWQIFIFGLIATGMGFLIVANWGFSWHISNRMTRLETKFEDYLTDAAMRELKSQHDVDNVLGIDEEIDELYDEYHRNDGDLSPEHWTKLYFLEKKVLDHPKATHKDIAQARFLMRLAKKKMERDGTWKDEYEQL